MAPAIKRKFDVYECLYIDNESLDYYKEYMDEDEYNEVIESDDEHELTIIIITDNDEWRSDLFDLIMIIDNKYVAYCDDVRYNSCLSITVSCNYLEGYHDNDDDNDDDRVEYSKDEILNNFIPQKYADRLSKCL